MRSARAARLSSPSPGAGACSASPAIRWPRPRAAASSHSTWRGPRVCVPSISGRDITPPCKADLKVGLYDAVGRGTRHGIGRRARCVLLLGALLLLVARPAAAYSVL